MMSTYDRYFEILEEIRIEKRIKIEDLCDNIVSIRTYYRYLNHTTPIKMDVFSKLMDRLNLDLSKIVIYGVHYRKQSGGDFRFPYRVHNKSYHDIIPLYQNTLETIDKEPNNHILKSIVLRYQYDVGLITKDSYRLSMIQIVEKIMEHKEKSIEDVNIYLSLLEADPKTPHTTLKTLIEDILKLDIRVNPIYYFMAVERTLSLSIGHKDIDRETYINYYDQIEVLFGYFAFNNIMMSQSLFKGYKYLLLGEERYREELYKYLMYTVNIYGKNEVTEFINKGNRAFDFDYKDFIIKETKKKSITHLNLI